MQCIISGGGHLDKVCAMGRGNMVVGVVEAVCFVCWYSEGVVICIVLSIPHLWIWKPCQAHFSRFGGYQIFHKILAPDLERSCLKHELVRHLYWWTMGWTCLNVTNNIRSHSLKSDGPELIGYSQRNRFDTKMVRMLVFKEGMVEYCENVLGMST